MPALVRLLFTRPFDPARLPVHHAVAEVAGLLAHVTAAAGPGPCAAYLEAQVLAPLGLPREVLAAFVAVAAADAAAAPPPAVAKALKTLLLQYRALAAF